MASTPPSFRSVALMIDLFLQSLYFPGPDLRLPGLGSAHFNRDNRRRGHHAERHDRQAHCPQRNSDLRRSVSGRYEFRRSVQTAGHDGDLSVDRLVSNRIRTAAPGRCVPDPVRPVDFRVLVWCGCERDLKSDTDGSGNERCEQSQWSLVSRCRKYMSHTYLRRQRDLYSRAKEETGG